MEFRKDNMSEYCKNCYKLQEQLDQLKAENKHINDLLNQALKELEKTRETLTEIKEIAEECYYKCNSMNNCNISCKYYNDCNGEFSYLLAYLNKQISEVEDEN